MKKQIILVCMSVLTVFGAVAQNAEILKKERFGIRAGLNIAKESYKQSGMSLTLDNQTGVLAGLVYECPLTEQLYVGTGLLFSQKGGKFETDEGSTKEILNYLDLPLNLVFKADLKGPKLLLEAGPQFSYALSGKDKTEVSGMSVSEDIEFGSGEDQVKRFDFGLNLGGGIEFMDFQLKVNYVIGLADISNFSGGSVKNNTLGISLSYFF